MSALPTEFEKELEERRKLTICYAETMSQDLGDIACGAQGQAESCKGMFLLSYMEFFELMEEYAADPEKYRQIVEEWNYTRSLIENRYPEAAKLLN